MNGLRDIEEKTGLFYYIMMKDFERDNLQKGKRRIHKPNSREKLYLHKQNKHQLDNIFAFINVRQHIAGQHLVINNYDELFEFFSTINLTKIMTYVTALDTFYPCKIIEGNEAWISKSDSGHYRYFSRNKDNHTIGFDFTDLLEVYYGVKTSQTVERAVEDFRIRFMEDEWMNQQNKKYLSNLTIIHHAKKHIEKDYPDLYNCICKHLKILETMNVLGNIHVKNRNFSFHDENIFFASSSYVADFLGTQPLSTTNKIINLFAVLGLIQKLPEENIPAQLLHESKIIAEKRNLGNIVSYYIVFPMVNIIAEANQKAKVMSQHNIRYSNISKEKIAYVFGEDLANLVYVQEIQKNKKKNTVPLSYIHAELERNLLTLLEEKGYAPQKAVFRKSIPHIPLSQRERELKKIWKSLILKNDLQYIKPTLQMKQAYKLKSSEYIAVRTTRT